MWSFEEPQAQFRGAEKISAISIGDRTPRPDQLPRPSSSNLAAPLLTIRRNRDYDNP